MACRHVLKELENSVQLHFTLTAGSCVCRNADASCPCCLRCSATDGSALYCCTTSHASCCDTICRCTCTCVDIASLCGCARGRCAVASSSRASHRDCTTARAQDADGGDVLRDVKEVEWTDHD